MRIGIDARLWSETGVGRYIRNLTKELQEIDKKNEYVLFVKNSDFDAVRTSISSDNWKVIATEIKWHTFVEQIKFPFLLRNYHLDLVHFPYFSVPVLTTIPFVVTIHDLILHHFPTGKASTLPLPFYKVKLFAYYFVISQAARRARKILAVSNATKKEILDHLRVQDDKVVVTYEGVDDRIEITEGVIRQEQKQPYFLYVGNAYPHKNLSVVLHAFKEILHDQEVKNCRLLLVGKEDYFYRRLKVEVQNLGLEKNVEFKGYVSDKELTHLYENALALLCPSKMEGFGFPGLEAMVQKCLVLASDIPTHKEIYQDAALYFEPHNVYDIQEKLKSVLKKRKDSFKHYIEKGIERVKYFSWKKTAQNTLQIYSDAAPQ